MINELKLNLNRIGFKNSTTIINDDFMNYEFKCKYDYILCVGVFSHIKDPSIMLNKIHKILKKNGYLIIQISDRDHYRYKRSKEKFSGYGYPLNKTNRLELFYLLECHGFYIEQEEGYSWSFFPLNRLSQNFQFKVLNFLRKHNIFKRLNSEFIYKCSIR